MKHLPYVGVIALAVFILFHRFFLFGDILLPPNATSGYPWYPTEAYTEPHPQGSMDAARENYITWAHHNTYLEEGYAPDWNPYIFAGNPLLANNFSIPYSPFKLLNAVFSAPVAWSWAQVLKLAISGFFTYCSVLALGRSQAASTIAALAWMLSWPLAHQTQTTYNEGVHLLPLVFFLLLRCYQSDRIVYALAGGLAVGALFLVGNIQMTVYIFLMLLAFAIYWAGWQVTERVWWKRATPLWILTGIFVAGVLVGSVQIWPTYELLGFSIRGEAQTYLNKGIEPYTSISFLNPWIYFWRNFEFPDLRTEYWLNTRWNPYIGILTLFAFVLALRFVKHQIARALMILTVGVYALLHILYLRPIFNAVSGIPGYDLLDQARFLIVMPFPMAIIAAYGIDWILEHAPQKWRQLRPMLVLLSLALPVMLVCMLALMAFFDNERAATFPNTFDGQRTQIGTQVIHDYYQIQNPIFAVSFVYVVIAIALIALYARGIITRGLVAWGFIALVAIDMLGFTSINVASTPREHVYPTTSAIAFLQSQPGTFRIGAQNMTLREGRATGDYSTYRDDHGWYLSSTLEPLIPNTAGLFGLQDVRGYESVYTLDYSRYLSRLDGRSGAFGAGAWPTNTIVHPMLDALNMQYLLSVEPIEHDALELVYDGEIYIYENINALPRVSLYAHYEVVEDNDAVLDALSDPGFDPSMDLYFAEGDAPSISRDANAVNVGTATITRYEPNRVTIEVSGSGDRLLVLGDMDYPGWVARLNGEAVPIHRANYLFRAVVIPTGEHELEFEYDSPIVNISRAISVGSAAVLVLAIILAHAFRSVVLPGATQNVAQSTPDA